MDLQGSVAVITGGGSGIGEALALNMVGHGMKVVLGDVSPEALDQAKTKIRAMGGEVETVICDVTKDEDVAALMERAVEAFGAINAVVPCAGIIRDGLFVSTDRETGKVKKTMSTEQFRSVIDINLVGTFITLREAAARMVDNGYPGVLFTISSVQKVGGVGQLNYSSTKAAVAMWPKLLVGEFQMKNIKGIRVVAIAPGYVGTPMVKGMNQKALDAILSQVHLGRLIEPDEIADTIRYVLQNEAINATCLEVTGGTISGMIAK